MSPDKGMTCILLCVYFFFKSLMRECRFREKRNNNDIKQQDIV